MLGGIFLDRDGTIIRDMIYLCNPNNVELLPKSQKAIKRFLIMGYKLFLFSNQSGVGRGMFEMSDVQLCNDKMIELLGFGKYLFSGVCIATEHPNNEPIYRKPSPKFINEMIEKYNLNKNECFMIGDKYSDIMAGLNAEIKSIFITGGKAIDDENVKQLICEKNIEAYVDLFAFSKTLI